jgi:hypothetical protein
MDINEQESKDYAVNLANALIRPGTAQNSMVYPSMGNLNVFSYTNGKTLSAPTGCTSIIIESTPQVTSRNGQVRGYAYYRNASDAVIGMDIIRSGPILTSLLYSVDVMSAVMRVTNTSSIQDSSGNAHLSVIHDNLPVRAADLTTTQLHNIARDGIVEMECKKGPVVALAITERVGQAQHRIAPPRPGSFAGGIKFKHITRSSHTSEIGFSFSRQATDGNITGFNFAQPAVGDVTTAIFDTDQALFKDALGAPIPDNCFQVDFELEWIAQFTGGDATDTSFSMTIYDEAGVITNTVYGPRYSVTAGRDDRTTRLFASADKPIARVVLNWRTQLPVGVICAPYAGSVNGVFKNQDGDLPTTPTIVCILEGFKEHSSFKVDFDTLVAGGVTAENSTLMNYSDVKRSERGLNPTLVLDTLHTIGTVLPSSFAGPEYDMFVANALNPNDAQFIRAFSRRNLGAIARKVGNVAKRAKEGYKKYGSGALGVAAMYNPELAPMKATLDSYAGM